MLDKGENMKLSIIIVTYNSEKYIRQCIDSIINSDIKVEYEICIIDNNSSDNTILLVKNYCINNKNIKLIKSKNKGFNYANNIGIKNTNGELILLLNPDTIILDNAIQKLVDYSLNISISIFTK